MLLLPVPEHERSEGLFSYVSCAARVPKDQRFGLDMVQAGVAIVDRDHVDADIEATYECVPKGREIIVVLSGHASDTKRER